MYCFILYQVSSNLNIRYASMYHYSNLDELEHRIRAMENNGNIIIDVQKDIDNFIVAAV